MKGSTLIALVLAVTAWSLSGCGSCEPAEKASAPAPAPAQKAPEPPPPAAQPPAAQQQPAAPPAAAQPTAGEDPEPDCFVIVDAEPDFGGPPLKVSFTTEIDCTAEPVVYSWDFGDGTTGGNEANPTHVYEKVGEYVATVTTKSPDGGEGEDEIDITVDPDFKE
jgi:predicted lipid-binding transport protein (Tim44 family)